MWTLALGELSSLFLNGRIKHLTSHSIRPQMTPMSLNNCCLNLTLLTIWHHKQTVEITPNHLSESQSKCLQQMVEWHDHWSLYSVGFFWQEIRNQPLRGGEFHFTAQRKTEKVWCLNRVKLEDILRKIWSRYQTIQVKLIYLARYHKSISKGFTSTQLSKMIRRRKTPVKQAKF